MKETDCRGITGSAIHSVRHVNVCGEHVMEHPLHVAVTMTSTVC